MIIVEIIASDQIVTSKLSLYRNYIPMLFA